jgi:hypothetical protein
MKAILNYDAITGEAAAVAMGLVLAGRAARRHLMKYFKN